MLLARFRFQTFTMPSALIEKHIQTLRFHERFRDCTRLLRRLQLSRDRHAVFVRRQNQPQPPRRNERRALALEDLPARSFVATDCLRNESSDSSALKGVPRSSSSPK